MTSRRSLEFRLAAWYSALLLAGLAALGGALWLGVDYTLTQSVDDLLTARLESLDAFVRSEFGEGAPDLSGDAEEGEVKGEIEKIGADGSWLVIADARVGLTPETRFDSDYGEFSAADLEPGMYVGVEVERSDGRWVAFEISEERSFETELRAELREYALGAPDGGLIQVRTTAGSPVLAGAAGPDWIENPGEGRSLSTMDTTAGPYRVLRDKLALAGRPHEIQLATSFGAVSGARRRLIGLVFLAAPLSLVLSLGGGYLISRRALRPIEDVVDVAETMTVDRLDRRLDVAKSGDVIERLGATFNSMLDRLESSVKRLEEFTADASHELRSPVSVIRTTAELALRQDRTPDELRRDMADIEEETGRLSELVDDLLTLARADGKAESPAMEITDLGAIVQEVGAQYQRLPGGKDIEVEIEPRRATVRGHAPSLRRLMVILLDNAVRHTPGDTRISLQVGGSSNQVEVTVSDQGEGIPADVLPRIFDRFYRSDRSRNRSEGGFGLGLSIAKWIVESHGGRIAADSLPGKGSTFTASFPRADSTAG